MMSVATCTTLRAPLAQVLPFVRYHLNMGVEHMYLFFDDPLDPAFDALAAEPRLTCVRCDDAHWASIGRGPRSGLRIPEVQQLNSVIALGMARDHDYEWILHLDADELVYCETGMKSYLASRPPSLQAVKANVLEAIPSRIDHAFPFEDIQRFRVGIVLSNTRAFKISLSERIIQVLHRNGYRARCQAAQLMGCRQPFEHGYVKGHSHGKTVTRTRAPVQSLTCHYPLPVEGRRLTGRLFSPLQILHYDAPRYDLWRAKWINRYQLNGNDRERAIQNLIRCKYSVCRQEQFVEFIRRLENDADSLVDLYRQWYFVTEAEAAILRKLKLLRDIRLDPRLFSKTPTWTRTES